MSARHKWGKLHWERANNPVALTLFQNFTDASVWDKNGASTSHFRTAVTDWDASGVLGLTLGSSGSDPLICPAIADQIVVCSANYGNLGWLGIAQVWASKNHIQQALAKMNDYYFAQPFYNTDPWRQLVMCQEIGHDFGLDHQDEAFNNPNKNTCMDYTNNPVSNQHPNQHDYDQLESIYGHLDGEDDGGGNTKPCNPKKPGCASPQTPPPAFGMELPGIGQWGELIETSRDGGRSTFVQDFGDDHHVYTHVTWTLEVAAQLRHRDEH